MDQLAPPLAALPGLSLPLPGPEKAGRQAVAGALPRQSLPEPPPPATGLCAGGARARLLRSGMAQLEPAPLPRSRLLLLRDHCGSKHEELENV